VKWLISRVELGLMPGDEDRDCTDEQEAEYRAKRLAELAEKRAPKTEEEKAAEERARLATEAEVIGSAAPQVYV
jgi:hypothetical protein